MGRLPRCRDLIRRFILVVLGDNKRENRSIFLRFSQLGQLCGDHRKELLLGQNRDAQLPGLGELAAGLLPADNVAGLAGHGAASGGPEADDLAVDAVTGEVLQLARSNDGAAVEGAVSYAVFVFHGDTFLSIFKCKFFLKRFPQLQIVGNAKPGVNISTQRCAEVWQHGKVKAAYCCFLKRIQAAAKVAIQRSACSPSNHGNVHSHQIPCKGGLSAGVDGSQEICVRLDAEALYAYNLMAVSVQMVEVLICGQESRRNELVQYCF